MCLLAGCLGQSNFYPLCDQCNSIGRERRLRPVYIIFVRVLTLNFSITLLNIPHILIIAPRIFKIALLR